jgi:hypothetical protein
MKNKQNSSIILDLQESQSLFPSLIVSLLQKSLRKFETFANVSLDLYIDQESHRKFQGGAFDLVGMEREVASEAIIIINKGMHTQTW